METNRKICTAPRDRGGFCVGLWHFIGIKLSYVALRQLNYCEVGACGCCAAGVGGEGKVGCIDHGITNRERCATRCIENCEADKRSNPRLPNDSW